MTRALEGQVALVTGATRGAGRGIAIELGVAGATVYCTGRTTRAQRSPLNRPETIEETAELVTQAGGTGIAVRVDHMEIDQVRELVDRIDREQDGRIDLLVNDIWGGQGELTDNWFRPFWEHDLAGSLAIGRNAVETHIITSYFVMPLMVKRKKGLIIGITDGRPDEFHDNLFYDLPKKSVMRLAVAHGTEGKKHGITGVAISPGYLRSEEALEKFGVTEENWPEYYWRDPERGDLAWLTSESPRFTGRAVVALATDPNVARWNCRTVYAEHLAVEYGFTDLHGETPGQGIYGQEHLKAGNLRREDYLPQ